MGGTAEAFSPEHRYTVEAQQQLSPPLPSTTTMPSREPVKATASALQRAHTFDHAAAASAASAASAANTAAAPPRRLSQHRSPSQRRREQRGRARRRQSEYRGARRTLRQRPQSARPRSRSHQRQRSSDVLASRRGLRAAQAEEARERQVAQAAASAQHERAALLARGWCEAVRSSESLDSRNSSSRSNNNSGGTASTGSLLVKVPGLSKVLRITVACSSTGLVVDVAENHTYRKYQAVRTAIPLGPKARPCAMLNHMRDVSAAVRTDYGL